MGGRGRLRRLAGPDGESWWWRVGHRHRADGAPCQETLVLYRDGRTDRPAARLVFRGGPGRVAGSEAYSHSGLVSDEHGNTANLHLPSVVRAFVDVVRARETAGGEAHCGEMDGWPLLPAAVRYAAAATPGAPPCSPPGP
ncbi:hypothetical protein HGI09_44110 [Streptomyces collinus]|nr:hypothetical protein [Streptomyces collinus]UJA08094.1 hypothetical protein HGI10_20000 [Streptomyces collinus]UJA17041.1 hypothetical protein HGI09_44110 [Streptomyces collinus]